jgi:hypothetical protein
MTMSHGRTRPSRTSLVIGAAALAVATLLGTAAPAQAAPASSSITITGLKSSNGTQYIKGGKLTISGKTSTSLRKRTLTVSLSRGSKTAALNISTRVSAASRFSVTVPVNVDAGTVKYSLRYAGTKTVKPASATKSITVLQWFPLVDQDEVDESWLWSTGSASVAGKKYSDLLASGGLYGNSSAYAEYNLGYHCSSFSALFGLTDQSSTNALAELAVSSDGIQRSSRRLTVGKTAQVTVDLSGAFRLRLDAKSLADATSYAAFPGAQVLCNADPSN